MATRTVDTATTFIYGLSDPRTGELRWVGKSDDPERRLRGHIGSRDSDTPRGAWLRELWALDLVPVLAVLEEVAMDDWPAAEQEWIAAKLAEGCALVNVAPGGAGGDTRVHGAPAVRLKMSEAHKTSPLAADARRRAGLKMRGVPKSPEHRAKIGAAQIGRVIPREQRRALSEARRGKPIVHFTAEVRAKSVAAMTATKRARAVERATRVQAFRAQGMHPVDIAERVGCTFQTVYVDLKRKLD